MRPEANIPEGPCFLGIDLGSSGLRLALVDRGGQPILNLTSAYPAAFDNPLGWRNGVVALVARIAPDVRERISAIAVDGTSGTLLLCRPDGGLAEGPLARALPYHHACPEQLAEVARLLAEDPAARSGPAASAAGSLARALCLLKLGGAAARNPDLWLRHQADWLSGWLLGDWQWGEEGNNVRLGWDLERHTWAGQIASQPWAAALPQIRPSGAVLGPVAGSVATQLGLPPSCRVVAGSTDANAAVLAARPAAGEGITVLGTTLVVKQFVPAPIHAGGISCHRVDGRWLVGGASSTGAGILRRFFSDGELAELSRQIDPRRPSGLNLRPLMRRGERFPVDDPDLEPILEPRPVSDALYLQGLLEGLAAIEAAGWQRLQACGAPPLQRVITLGGGAVNPQWRLLREQLLGVPVLNRPQLTAALGMAELARTATLTAPADGSMGLS